MTTTYPRHAAVREATDRDWRSDGNGGYNHRDSHAHLDNDGNSVFAPHWWLTTDDGDTIPLLGGEPR